jgi:hypothetical protein
LMRVLLDCAERFKMKRTSRRRQSFQNAINGLVRTVFT